MERGKSIDRIELIQCRVKALRRKKEDWSMAGLTVMCLILIFFLGELLYGKVNGTPIEPLADDQFFGAILLVNAGGYALVGVLAFALGVFFAIGCLRFKKRG